MYANQCKECNGLGDLGATGERFRIISSSKGGRVNCPPGTTQESSGKMGTGQPYAWCYRPPVFAPPPTTTVTYHAPTTTTTVSPAVQTAISPQISPTMAQQQASPGATVAASPQQTAGGQAADTGYRPGLTGDQVRAMMDAERRARDAEAMAQEYREGLERAQRQEELQAFRDVYEKQAAAATETMQREIAEADARRAAIEMADTEAAAEAQAGAMYIPPPPSMTPMAPPMLTSPTPIPSGPPPPPGAAVETGTPWGMIMLAVAAVGIVAAGAAGKRKRKR